MRKILNLLFVFPLIFIIVACSNNEEVETGANDEEVVTLNLWNRYPELREPFDILISEFEEQYPNIKIEKQDLPLDSHEAQLQTAISSGELPDIFTTGADLTELVDNDLVKNLDEVFTSEVKAEYHEGTWWESGTTLNDSVYVFPFVAPQTGAMMMYYNLNVLEDLGIGEDEVPKTWEEFKAISKRISEESNGQISSLAWNNEAWSNEGVVSMVGTAISPETTYGWNLKEGVPSYISEGILQSAEFLKELYDNGFMAANSLEVSTIDAEAHFAAGTSAFWFSGPWTGNHLINDHNLTNWGVAPLPTNNGDFYYYPAARQADGLQVNEDTENWEEVKIFLEFSLDNLYEPFYVNTGLGIPAKKGVEGELAFEQQQDIVDLQLKHVIPIPRPVQVNLDTIEFQRQYNNTLEFQGVGDAVVGYIGGQIDDLESTLEQRDQTAKQNFTNLLEESSNVTKEDFTFPNWVPFEPYTLEDYEE
ncbi:ABC transporter substrate-binding protein [Bacillus sp. TS-2]|nr:ABC transporter substrate-binding protein [Bacillus sp. TS-2]